MPQRRKVGHFGDRPRMNRRDEKPIDHDGAGHGREHAGPQTSIPRRQRYRGKKENERQRRGSDRGSQRFASQPAEDDAADGHGIALQGRRRVVSGRWE